MTNPYRDMCAELVQKWDDASCDQDLLDVDDAIEHARALLAQLEPVAEGPTDEDVDAWADQQEFIRGHGDHPCGFWIDDGDAGALVRAALTRWGTPTPQPVAVSERLPGPEDCLDEGWAWFFNQRIGWRQAVLPVSPGYTHWLPANALPIPEAND